MACSRVVAKTSPELNSSRARHIIKQSGTSPKDHISIGAPAHGARKAKVGASHHTTGFAPSPSAPREAFGRGTPRPVKIEFARQPIILQMASKKNGDTTDAWRSQAVSATSTQWLGKQLTISSIGRTGGDVSFVTTDVCYAYPWQCNARVYHMAEG